MKKVGIIMGSDSDLPVVEKAIDTLKSFGVTPEVHVYSAHRTPCRSPVLCPERPAERHRSHHRRRRKGRPSGRRSGCQHHPAGHRSAGQLPHPRRY